MIFQIYAMRKQEPQVNKMNKTTKIEKFCQLGISLRNSKKGLEMQYIIVIIILLLLFLIMVFWYSGLRQSMFDIINSFLR